MVKTSKEYNISPMHICVGDTLTIFQNNKKIVTVKHTTNFTCNKIIIEETNGYYAVKLIKIKEK